MPTAEDQGRLIDGKYRLGEVLRRDRWSVTYRAEHTGIQRYVALKTLPRSLAPEGPDAARLLREGRAAGSVAHRNVQSVVDLGSDDEGRPFVVYEILNGPTVADLIRDNPHGLDTQHAARIMLQALEGLEAVHKGGVVHRALGPERIVVTSVRGGGELAKITGFDEAVFRAEAEFADPPLSVPDKAYIAPEASRRGSVTPAIDVYAAGVILRALITGSPEPGGPMSDTARRAVDRATAVSPDERFPEAGLLVHAVALLIPTSQRPPREEMPTPEDPLFADLQYLQLRRSSRETHKPGPRGEARIQLLPMLLAIEAIYRRLGGEHWATLARRIPEVEDLLPGSGNTSLNVSRGVPVDLCSRVLSTADELAGRGDLSLVAEIGEMMAERGISRIVPSFPAPLRPATVVDSFDELWAGVTRQGEVLVLDRDRHAARLAVRGQVEPSLELCAMTAGMIRGGLRAGGANRIDVYTTACQALGDAACIYGITWDE